jgi:hypothetical protein
MTDDGCQMTDVGCQMSDVRCAVFHFSDLRPPTSDLRPPTSDIRSHFVQVATAVVPFMIDHLLSAVLSTAKQFCLSFFQVVQ